tara:strand:- start:853 stop:1044 length:192 start_codon:yes stop_codon:yes gene_type:complete
MKNQKQIKIDHYVRINGKRLRDDNGYVIYYTSKKAESIADKFIAKGDRATYGCSITALNSIFN